MDAVLANHLVAASGVPACISDARGLDHGTGPFQFLDNAASPHPGLALDEPTLFKQRGRLVNLGAGEGTWPGRRSDRYPAHDRSNDSADWTSNDCSSNGTRDSTCRGPLFICMAEARRSAQSSNKRKNGKSFGIEHEGLGLNHVAKLQPRPVLPVPNAGRIENGPLPSASACRPHEERPR